MKPMAFVPCLALLVSAGCGGAAKEISPATSAAPDGDLTGTVRSADGRPIEGVVVARTAPSSPASEVTTVTDREGVYRFAYLAPGTYSLRIEKKGCTLLAEEGVVVRPYRTERMNVQLQPADGSPEAKSECARGLPVPAALIPVAVPSGKGGSVRPIIRIASAPVPGSTTDGASAVPGTDSSSCRVVWTAPSGTRFCY
jgi:hypothetical protein